MLTTVSILILGILTGVVLKHQKSIIKVSSKLTDVSVYLLLLFLEISIGANDDVWNNLSTIGVTALAISVMGIIGSVLVSFVVFKLFFSKKDNQ